MSTIAALPGAALPGTALPGTVRPRVRAPRVRLTRRGRVVFFLGFLIAALVAMVVAAGLATATKEAGTPERVRVIQVQSGDTLYDIAGGLARPGHVRDMVQRVSESEAIEDDHVNFLNAGVPAVDLIDLQYRAWHTADDTLDNISARSLQIVGDVILDALPAIEKRLSTGRG